MDSLEETAFVKLPAGGSLDKTFDVAKFYDLSAGGDFKIQASGYLQYAEPGSTQITGIIPFSSEFITKVDGTEAKAKFSASQIQEEIKRSTFVRQTCNSNQQKIVKDALSLCHKNSQQAAKAARSGPPKRMKEYFKSDSRNTREIVAKVFDDIARECKSSTSGQLSISCKDTDFCKSNRGVPAYSAGKEVVLCPPWFKQPVNGKCHQGDKASAIIHEFSHGLKGFPHFGVYGYDKLLQLPAEKNIKHADTYTYFSNAVEVNC
jgi:deuterolysin